MQNRQQNPYSKKKCILQFLNRFICYIIFFTFKLVFLVGQYRGQYARRTYYGKKLCMIRTLSNHISVHELERHLNTSSAKFLSPNDERDRQWHYDSPIKVVIDRTQSKVRNFIKDRWFKIWHNFWSKYILVWCTISCWS